MTGNEAVGEAAVRAGCFFYAGYPITPQNELTAFMSRRMRKEKRIFIQAESEISAINMVFGAAASGVRAMTSSSSPGMSLKQEGISYLAACRLPCLIVNVMRGGPGLGNIGPGQADYFQATKGGGHGDYHCIVLAPSTVQESMQLVMLGFDLADKYRMPVIILGDGMLGQMMEPIILPKKHSIYKRPKPKSWALTGASSRKPNIIRSLLLKRGALEEHNRLLQKTYRNIQVKECRSKSFFVDDAKIILVAFGSVARIAQAAVRRLRQKGKRVGLIQPLTLWPFPKQALKRACGKQNKFLVVEMNEGQMLEDVLLSLEGKSKVSFLGRSGGGVPTEEEIIKRVKNLLIK